jgi:MFS family permease
MGRFRRPVHYAWVIVAAGTLTTFSALGLGRFALGMLLPSMGKGLDLDYPQMGIIGTANFLGYLLAVLTSGILVARTGARALIAASLVFVGASMVAVSRATSYPSVLVLYFVTGVGSGAANVPMMSLVAAWFGPRLRGRAAGFIVIGSGFAILLSGRLVPALNREYGGEGWRAGWLVLGWLCWPLRPSAPSCCATAPPIGLEPAGGGGGTFTPPRTTPGPPRGARGGGSGTSADLLSLRVHLRGRDGVVTALVRACFRVGDGLIGDRRAQPPVGAGLQRAPDRIGRRLGSPSSSRSGDLLRPVRRSSGRPPPRWRPPAHGHPRS